MLELFVLFIKNKTPPEYFVLHHCLEFYHMATTAAGKTNNCAVSFSIIRVKITRERGGWGRVPG